MVECNVFANHFLAANTSSNRVNNNAHTQTSQTRLQAPIGLPATWTITIRERENGLLDWINVKTAYLELWGAEMPFRW